MIQGTTPLHTFSFPSNPEEFAEIEIVYAQGDDIILRKTKADLTFGENNTASLRLTQAESLLFTCNKCAVVQVRVLTTMGEALATHPAKVGVDEIIRKEVLTVENDVNNG